MERILVIAEHSDGRLKAVSSSAVGFASLVCQACQGAYDVLILGSGIRSIGEILSSYGAGRVLLADSPFLAEPIADRYAEVIARLFRAGSYTMLVAASSTFSKDIVPRAAGLLDAGMVSDVGRFEVNGGELVFRRSVYAGNAIALVRLDGPIRVLTVRASAFSAPAPTRERSPLHEVEVDARSLPNSARVISRAPRPAGRPDATEARVVVSGGRALKNAEEFEALVGGLADALGAAVGSSRALVDAGVTPNSLQIGQTGKVVAPDLYIAVGISGAIQHTAGMKDAKVIAAINKDPEAPIFEVADFGLVADVHQAVPELIAKVRRKEG